jgi:hypothetical protein
MKRVQDFLPNGASEVVYLTGFLANHRQWMTKQQPKMVNELRYLAEQGYFPLFLRRIWSEQILNIFARPTIERICPLTSYQPLNEPGAEYGDMRVNLDRIRTGNGA